MRIAIVPISVTIIRNGVTIRVGVSSRIPSGPICGSGGGFVGCDSFEGVLDLEEGFVFCAVEDDSRWGSGGGVSRFIGFTGAG